MVRRRRAGKRLVALQVGRFALAGVVAVAIVAIATSVASRRVGEREAIADVRTRTVIKAQGVVQPALTDAVLAGSAAAITQIDAAVQREVLDDSLVRVKIWDQNGTIVYSDEPRLIGTRYDLGANEQAALRTGQIEAEVSDLGKPENRYERTYDKLLEVYLPIETPSGQPLLFESYYRYALVADKGRQLWGSFAPITLGALILLGLVQIPLAYSLARRLRQRSEQRVALLRQTVQASDSERRHIASDLHDGVVQDLAGVAYALSAVSRRAGATDSTGLGSADVGVVEQSAASVRASIRALRSLVVDIYPPDFGEVTLASALADLIARFGEEGLETSLDVDGLHDPLPDPIARVLYRAAQEGLRNVVKHAHATAAKVTVATIGVHAVLDVDDDGSGFDTSAPTLAGGHLGLTVLRGLVTDSGGVVEIRSAPGAGTTLHVEMPL